MADSAIDTLLDIVCPRCGTDTEARFYGPCRRCVADLRASQTTAGGSYEAASYEPKMNVVPNQIATKE